MQPGARPTRDHRRAHSSGRSGQSSLGVQPVIDTRLSAARYVATPPRPGVARSTDSACKTARGISRSVVSLPEASGSALTGWVLAQRAAHHLSGRRRGATRPFPPRPSADFPTRNKRKKHQVPAFNHTHPIAAIFCPVPPSAALLS